MDKTVQEMINTICCSYTVDCRDCPLFIKNNTFGSYICLITNMVTGEPPLEIEKYVVESYKKKFPDGSLSLPAEITVTEFMEVFK